MERKDRIQLAVIAVGLAVLAFFLVRNLKAAGKRPSNPAVSVQAPAQPSGPATVPVSRSADKTLGLQEKRWEAAWGRDPFRALSDTAGRLVELQLRGISFSPAKKGYAYINDQIVTIGDTIGGYTVSRIEKDKVLLTRSAQTFILTFIDDEGQ